MKKFLLLGACVVFSVTTPASTTHSETSTKQVYICTGKSAKVFHYDKDCYGLGNCKATIKSVDLNYAIKIGRKPCRICVQ